MTEIGRLRLTSWKEIAGHLGKDVRTVLRWEKDRGLPIHRVPGATGRALFAYTDELDAWATGVPVPEAVPAAVAAGAALAAHSSQRTAAILTAGGLMAVLSLAAWFLMAMRNAPPGALTIRVDEQAIVASTSAGVERWHYLMPAGDTATATVGREQHGEAIEGGDLLVATGLSTRRRDGVVRSGELYRFSSSGVLEQTFSFDDRARFAGGVYGPPWGVTDFRVQPGGGRGRIAIAAHHHEWWPSIVTVLDETWNRRGTFTNAGWVERLLWVSPDRLVIAGFSNILDGGMVALLDANAIDGQSPAAPGSEFECASCPAGRPIRYVVLPRSELNRVTSSRFNRVILGGTEDGLVARTIEVPSTADPADALYEFTPQLDLVHASYSDRYWQTHRELEAAGKIKHTRQQCPDRDGPREMRVWTPATGWTTETIPRPQTAAALRPPALTSR